MSETKRPDAFDEMLRSSLAGPAPTLPRDFDRRVMRRVRQKSQPLDRRARTLLAAYALLSVIISALLMRSQGLGWIPTAATILGTLAVATIVARLTTKHPSRQQPHVTARH